MKSIVAAALALAYAQSVFGFTVNTPTNVVQCQPILLTWSDGVPPYFPSIIPGGQPSAPALETFPTTSATSLTWNVDIGGSVTIALKDSTGATAFTDIVNIQASSTGSCANSGGSSSGAASAPPATGSAPPAAGTTAGTSAVASGSKPAVPATSAAGASSPARPSVSGSQAAAASAKPSSGAVRTSVTYGLAGVLAAVGAALA